MATDVVGGVQGGTGKNATGGDYLVGGAGNVTAGINARHHLSGRAALVTGGEVGAVVLGVGIWSAIPGKRRPVGDTAWASPTRRGMRCRHPVLHGLQPLTSIPS